MTREPDHDPNIWYQCDRCTACCKWPGDVRLEDGEAEKIAEYLEMDLNEFIDQLTRLRSDRQGLSIIEKENHECSMLENNQCKIHAVKPIQCQGFPNKWNFKGWRQVCHAKAYPLEKARQLGFCE